MGFFDKLFKKRQSDQSSKIDKLVSEPSIKMLDGNLFWTIIDSSLKNSQSQNEQESYLIKEIEKLSSTEMVGFFIRLNVLTHAIYTSTMWCAAHLMNGGYASDDGFEYFRYWIISRGKKVYYNAKNSPDSLVIEYSSDKNEYAFETLSYVAIKSYQNSQKIDDDDEEQIFDYFYACEENCIDVDYSKFEDALNHLSNFDIDWNEDKPESMKALCPNLYQMVENKT